jgi:hypothetical protein
MYLNANCFLVTSGNLIDRGEHAFNAHPSFVRHPSDYSIGLGHHQVRPSALMTRSTPPVQPLQLKKRALFFRHFLFPVDGPKEGYSPVYRKW